jgi:hypothetical protein
MVTATFGLKVRRDVVGIVTLAAPCRIIFGRAVRAGSAIDLLGGLL